MRLGYNDLKEKQKAVTQAGLPWELFQTFQTELEQLEQNHHATLDQIDALTNQHKTLSKEALELRAKAKTIEDAVYDLKAVNPNAQVEEDARTPAELIRIIEEKGGEVAEALALLKS
jgi:type I restriction enzyme M protein